MTNIITSKQAIRMMEANGYIIQDVLPPNIAVSPELRDGIKDELSTLYNIYSSHYDRTGMENIKRILAELGVE